MKKKALLTGSTGGLGGHIASLLAASGWDLVLLNRNQELAERQLGSLRTNFPDQSFDSRRVDLMDLDDIRRCSEEVAESHPQINALYNVAGLLTDRRITSPQGIEGHFALNSVAPNMLTQFLRPQLAAAAAAEQKRPSLVANFSSEVVNGMKSLGVNKLVNPDSIGGLNDTYAKTKAVLNVVACFMKDELSKERTLIYAVDPGPTKTQMTSGNQAMPVLVRLLAPIVFGSPAKQAGKLVDKIESEVRLQNTGTFISNGKVKENPPVAFDKQIQADLRHLMNRLIETDKTAAL